METLIKQENFEIEVLNYLNSRRFLDNLIFIGGTMLRLCYGLERFSVDLDFWYRKNVEEKIFFTQIKDYLGKKYIIKDAANKFYTILFEIKKEDYPRNLKIEIRKEHQQVNNEKAIAFSRFSSIQVLVNTISLQDMMKYKIQSFIERKEIRDCFDIEFLIKKGVPLNATVLQIKKIIKTLDSLKPIDYKVKLSSLLPKELRKYYTEKNFQILRAHMVVGK